jgi:hypothetical protein
MKIGYARVSTLDQKPDLQRDALEDAGCEMRVEKNLRADGDFKANPLQLCTGEPGGGWVMPKLAPLPYSSNRNEVLTCRPG